MTYALHYYIATILGLVAVDDDDGNAGSNVNGKKPVKKEEQKAEQQSSNGKTVKDLMALVEKNWGVEAPKQAKTALMVAGFPKFEAEKWGEMLDALKNHFENAN